MNFTRIFDIAYYALQKYPQVDMFATKYNGVWQKLSTEEFVDLGNQFSRGLLRLGVKRDDKIAIITTTTRNEWVVVDFGILQVGGVVVPVYPTISSDDYEYIFSNAEIKYCFVSDESLLKKVEKIKGNIPSLKGIYSFDEIQNISNWMEILELGKDTTNQRDVETISANIHPDDVATIIYTSGTTAAPKGVMLTHNNIISNIKGCDDRIPIKADIHYTEVRALSFLPVCHIFERMLLYLYQSKGFSVYFAESIDKMGDNMKEVRPHYMTVVPRVIEKVYDKIYNKGISSGKIKAGIFLWALKVIENKKIIGKPNTLKEIIADKLVFSKWREGLGGRVYALICGSASLSERLNRIFQNAGIPIMEGYGLTETSPVIAVNARGKTKPRTVGPIISNLECKIQDDGEITVKGPSVFKGYFKNEELTKTEFTEDGYFKTGDIGFLDQDGYLTITDRKKEMFKTSGGKYIAPQIIENLAKASKFIEQIIVVGDGEKMPCAIVQPDFYFVKNWAKIKNYNIGETIEEISQNPILKQRIEKEIAKINKGLGNWEQIKKIELSPSIWSVEGGELTPTLKLKRRVIKEKYIQLYNKLYDRG